MEAYFSIGVSQGDDIISRSLMKAKKTMTMKALLKQYENGKFFTAGTDPNVKVGDRNATFDAHESSMDTVDINMTVRLIEDICGTITKVLFLFPSADMMKSTKRLLTSKHVDSDDEMPLVIETKSVPKASTPTPSSHATRSSRTSTLSTFFEVTSKPETSSARSKRKGNNDEASAITTLSKDALKKILKKDESKPLKAPAKPQTPKRGRGRRSKFITRPASPLSEEEAEVSQAESEDSNNDDDEDVEVMEQPVKRTSRRLSTSSTAQPSKPLGMLNIPLRGKGKGKRVVNPPSPPKPSPAKSVPLFNPEDQVNIAADGQIVVSKLTDLGEGEEEAIPEGTVVAAPKRAARKAATASRATKRPPVSARPRSTRNKQVVEISDASGDEEAATNESPNKKEATEEVEAEEKQNEEEEENVTKETRDEILDAIMGQEVTNADNEITSILDKSNEEELPEIGTLLPALAAASDVSSTSPDKPKKRHSLESATSASPEKPKKRLSLDMAVENQDEEPATDVTPLKRKATPDTTPNKRQSLGSEVNPALEEELAELLHSASDLEIGLLLEGNTGTDLEFLRDELNEVKRLVKVDKRGTKYHVVPKKKGALQDVIPNENPNTLFTDLLSKYENWSSVAMMIEYPRELNAPPVPHP